MSRRRSPGGPAFLAALLLLLAGCDNFITYQVWDGGPSITPRALTLQAGDRRTFEVKGGQPPYTFTIASGGGTLRTIDGTHAEYTAPGEAGTAVLRVSDGKGNRADASVTIAPPPPPALEISPAPAQVPAGDRITFQASGGTPPYAFSVASGPGTIGAASGVYSAPASPGAAVVRVTDDQGATADAQVTVTSPLSLLPAQVTLQPGEKRTFAAQGGQPPYTFSLASGGGTLSPLGGNQAEYTAPAAATTAVIRVTDALGNRDTATVRVNAPPPADRLVILPASVTVRPGGTVTFTASGGTPPYTFSLTRSRGGRVDAASGVYTAPILPNREEVTVTDAAGGRARAEVRVRF